MIIGSVSLSEQLDRLEASHVKLMTEHEVFVKEHEARVAEQDREWERQQERWRQNDLQREKDREDSRLRGAELDRRIADMVSGFGEFIRLRS